MKYILLIALTVTIPAYAQDCTSVIALSKTVSQSVADKNSFEQQAQSFCNEYSSAESSGKSMNAGGSYGVISGSFGSSKVSAKTMASKYCSAGNQSAASSDAYKNYVETISPNAYSAYEQCVNMSKDMKYGVDLNSVLPKQFSMTASFLSKVKDAKPALVTYSASNDVTCAWNNVQGKTLTIETGETEILECSRADSSQASFVTVIRNDSSEKSQMTLPWGAYDSNGIPVNTLLSLQSQVSDLSSRLDAVGEEVSRVSFLSGTFPIRRVATRALDDSSSCPTGDDAYRGELNGRIKFEKPFAAVPTVSVGLSHIDIGGATAADNYNRLYVGITGVDKEGFDYAFRTWCTTKVYGASASWIAVAK